MIDKLREKIWCKEILKEGFDKLELEDIKEMIGFVEPTLDGKNWEVTMMFEGNEFSCETQEHATIIANQEMIMAMMLKNMEEINGENRIFNV